mmetsp:Transcript_8684/g.24806  ORF Transcript_8684/g.24806 Transcript_8684/m.24806 type:complete len:249 (+) Transcript_8684:270-1016(+)
MVVDPFFSAAGFALALAAGFRVALVFGGGGSSSNLTSASLSPASLPAAPSSPPPEDLAQVLSCKSGTNTVVRPPTVKNEMPWPCTLGPFLSFLLPLPHRWWNSQSEGYSLPSRSSVQAVSTTYLILSCTSSLASRLNSLQRTSGCNRAWKHTSSTIQLPMPHTTFCWSSRTALTGELYFLILLKNASLEGIASRGSQASLLKGGVVKSCSQDFSLTRPRRRVSTNATRVSSAMTSSSLVNRGGHWLWS